VIGAVLDADPEAGGDGVVVVEVEQLAGDPRLPLRVDPEGQVAAVDDEAVGDRPGARQRC
jgi:hypothetical protein